MVRFSLGDGVVLRVGDPGRSFRVAARAIGVREIFPGEWRVWAKVCAVPVPAPPVSIFGRYLQAEQLLDRVICSAVDEPLEPKERGCPRCEPMP